MPETVIFYRGADGSLRAVRGVVVTMPSEPDGSILTRANAKLSVSAEDVLYRFLWEGELLGKFYLRVGPSGSEVVHRNRQGVDFAIGEPRSVFDDTEAPPGLREALRPYL